MNYTLLVIILALCQISFAQELDSIETKYRDYIKQGEQDSAFYICTQQTTYHFSKSDPKQATKWNKRASKLARTKEQKATSISQLGALMHMDGNFQGLLDQSIKALELYNTLPSKDNIAKARLNMYVAYRELGSIEDSYRQLDSMQYLIDDLSPTYLGNYYLCRANQHKEEPEICIGYSHAAISNLKDSPKYMLKGAYAYLALSYVDINKDSCVYYAKKTIEIDSLNRIALGAIMRTESKYFDQYRESVEREIRRAADQKILEHSNLMDQFREQEKTKRQLITTIIISSLAIIMMLVSVFTWHFIVTKKKLKHKEWNLQVISLANIESADELISQVNKLFPKLEASIKSLANNIRPVDILQAKFELAGWPVQKQSAKRHLSERSIYNYRSELAKKLNVETKQLTAFLRQM